MSKPRRISKRDNANIFLKARWDRSQERLKQRRESMEDAKLLETFARMWMQCDPNRGGSDPDELMPMKYSSGSIGPDGGETTTYPNQMGGQPRWKWFVPRAQASLEFLKSQGLRIESR